MMLQLLEKEFDFKQRVEYINHYRGHKIHAAYCHVFNLNQMQPKYYRSLLTLTRGNYELAYRGGRDGPFLPNLDFFDIAATYLSSKANLTAQLTLDPTKRSLSEAYLGISKAFSPGFFVKARYGLLSGTSSYYLNYSVSKDCSVAGSFQVNTRSSEGVFKGFDNQPFNFGLRINLNA